MAVLNDLIREFNPTELQVTKNEGREVGYWSNLGKTLYAFNVRRSHGGTNYFPQITDHEEKQFYIMVRRILDQQCPKRNVHKTTDSNDKNIVYMSPVLARMYDLQDDDNVTLTFGLFTMPKQVKVQNFGSKDFGELTSIGIHQDDLEILVGSDKITGNLFELEYRVEKTLGQRRQENVPINPLRAPVI